MAATEEFIAAVVDPDGGTSDLSKQHEILESFVNRALDVPEGRHLEALLSAEHRQDVIWRRLRAAGDVLSAPSPPPRPSRVLVEMRGTALAEAVQTRLREEGYQVALCSPSANLGATCPLVEGRHCPLADRADIIVHALGVEDAEGRSVLDAHIRSHPQIPRVVVTRTGGEGLSGTDHQVIIGGSLTQESLLSAIEGVLQAGT